MVTTEATAPGGARTEKVGLPFDPDLFDHMVQHGVVIEVGRQAVEARVHLAFLLNVCMYCVCFCCRPC